MTTDTPAVVRVKTAAEYLAAPTVGQWKAGTTWREKAAAAAVDAMRDQWAVDHDGAEPRSTIVTPLGAAIKKLDADESFGEDEARRAVLAARIIARGADLWARAFALRWGEQPVRSDLVRAIGEMLVLVHEGRDTTRILHAAEEAGHQGDPWVQTAYSELLTEQGRRRGDQWTLAIAAAELRDESVGLTPQQAREQVFQRKYGLSWRLPTLMSRTERMIAELEADAAAAPKSDLERFLDETRRECAEEAA